MLIGGNSIGKSTICEALDLLVGPDRLSRNSPVDEHDFHGRRYMDGDGNSIPIELECVLTDLSTDLEREFRNHLEFWNDETKSLLTETGGVEEVDQEHVSSALRVCFTGQYDREEDEFTARTYFASPPHDLVEDHTFVTRRDKRRFGYIYLRALRTGSRALSLERGSLLDIVLRLNEADRSEMWEKTLQSLEHLDPPIHKIPQLESILDVVHSRVQNFITLSQGDSPLELFPTALTRESLRKAITLFGSSELSDTSIPYWRLGSGVVNAMVFSLLTFIAEMKDNVMFAMEEPEISIPPHTQRRIIRYLRDKMEQVIVTTHSPFVLEQFDPNNVIRLDRSTDHELTGTSLNITGIKAKKYIGGLRSQYAEAMLGKGVLCVEGISDKGVLEAASAVMEANSTDDLPYGSLDLSGVTIIHCDGDGELVKHGEFFDGLGLNTYALYDHSENDDLKTQIERMFNYAVELEYKGIEKLLAEELHEEILREFLEDATELASYPNNPAVRYSEDQEEDQVREICFKVLKARKGEGYAQALVECCESEADLPDTLISLLEHIHDDLPAQIGLLEDEEETDEEETDEDAFPDGDE